MSEKNKRVRLGIDPFSDNLSNLKKMEEVVGSFVLAENHLVPTYLLDFQSGNWYEKIPLAMQDSLKASAGTRIKNQLEKVGVRGWEEPEIFTSNNLSKREKISYLADLLNTEGCDLFVVNTHARKGLNRLFLGSFAENLLLKCKVPLLFVSPNTAPVSKTEKVLFPTDFSQSSFEVLKKFLASSLGQLKDVEIYSMTLYYNSVATLGQFGGHEAVERFVHDSYSQKQKKFEDWKKEIAKYGVELSCVIEDTVSDLTEAILQRAEAAKSHMIVMGSFVSANEVIFSGSHTRDLVRNSELPVLVWHHQEN